MSPNVLAAVAAAVVSYLVQALRELLRILAWDAGRPLRRRDVMLCA